MAVSVGLLIFVAGWLGALGLFVAATAHAWKRQATGWRVLNRLDWLAGAVAAAGTLGLLLGPGGPAWYVRVLVSAGVVLVFPLIALVHRIVFR